MGQRACAKLSYTSFLRMTSRMRRLAVTASLITSRPDAAEVRAFSTQPVLLSEHRRIARQLTDEALRVEHHKTLIRLVGRALAGIGTGGAYLVLGLLLFVGALPLALAGAAALALRTANTAVGNTIYTSNHLYESSLYLDLYTTCLTDARGRARSTVPAHLTPAASADAAPPGPESPGGLDTDSPRVIELHDVSFTYPDQDRPAIAEVTLTLRAGQTVALVGENGSGMTTLAKLITGLYLPDTMVMQHPTQWPMTAANNIRIGRIHHPDPDGDRGWPHRLSRQSVARPNRAHRLANVRHADQILVLDHGRISAHGTHDHGQEGSPAP